MSTNSEHIVSTTGTVSPRAWPLHNTESTRLLEGLLSGTDGLSLMQTAGLALARLTLAIAPHARRIWIACGPGNNGGDGLEAARHLLQWGKQPIVTLAHDPARSPADAHQAWQSAHAAGVVMQSEAPTAYDVCIDALFGIGTIRPLTGTYAQWVGAMNASKGLTIAVDIPTGLHADTGTLGDSHVRADHTLSLLTLKPGLFTAHGRDVCGDIWFNDLGVNHTLPPQALLTAQPAPAQRPHASHKGSFGDVAVVGGASGMTGAALLAGVSALRGGAGRVFVGLLDEQAAALDVTHPELMIRTPHTLDLSNLTVVAGCGGGTAIASLLPELLQHAKQLVLDADALNQIALQSQLQELLARRPAGCTVLTPHPLEAARLLGCSAAQIQADRLTAAHNLAERFQCVTALKGSGTVISALSKVPYVNPTGNAKLATAGTGDVLAGLVGAYLAHGHPAQEATAAAVYRHGQVAERWPGSVLNASELCQQL